MPDMYQQIYLSDIDSSDETYCITTRTDDDNLTASIATIGLINPPVLEKKKSALTIVSGFRRVRALGRLNRTGICARILTPGTSRRECIHLAIAENSLQRDLNLIETSRALFLLSDVHKLPESLFRTAAALNLPASPSMINKIKPLCRMPSFIQQGILAEAVSLATADTLAVMGVDDGMALTDLFIGLKPSLNKQREILTLLKEISLREEVSIQALVTSGRIDKILGDSDLSRPQKLQLLREYLKKRRYPAITRAEKEFEITRRQLSLGTNIQLIPPKHFEGREYTLNLVFSTRGELGDLRRQIDTLLGSPVLEDMVP